MGYWKFLLPAVKNSTITIQLASGKQWSTYFCYFQWLQMVTFPLQLWKLLVHWLLSHLSVAKLIQWWDFLAGTSNN